MVRQIPDDRFQREGDDLVVHARIRLEDALGGGQGRRAAPGRPGAARAAEGGGP